MDIEKINAANLALKVWHDRHFPIKFENGAVVVTGHRLEAGSSWAAYPCAICGGVHLHDTLDSIAKAHRPCLEDHVLLFIREDERTVEELRAVAQEWVRERAV